MGEGAELKETGNYIILFRWLCACIRKALLNAKHKASSVLCFHWEEVSMCFSGCRGKAQWARYYTLFCKHCVLSGEQGRPGCTIPLPKAAPLLSMTQLTAKHRGQRLAPHAGRCLDGSHLQISSSLFKKLLTKIPTWAVVGCLVKKPPPPSAGRGTWGRSGFPGFAAHLASTFQECLQQGRKLTSFSVEIDLEVWLFPYG